MAPPHEADQSRIPVDADYLMALGRAFYNFTYLEWIVIWTIAKLSADGFLSVPSGETAKVIANALIRAINTTAPNLSAALRRDLVKFHESYLAAKNKRDKLLHAHPYTTQDGLQQLGGGGFAWPIRDVEAAAKQFEDAAIVGNDLFHGALSAERP